MQGMRMLDRKRWQEHGPAWKKWRRCADGTRSKHGVDRSRQEDQGKGRIARHGHGGQGVKRFEGKIPELDRVGKTSEIAGTCHKGSLGLRQHRTCSQRRP